MKLSRTTTFVFLCLIVFLLCSCVSPEESVVDSNTLRPNVNANFNANVANANINANVAQDDEQKLDELVNLPFVPEENAWRQDTVGDPKTVGSRVPGPTDHKLTAVLKFSKADTASIISKAGENAAFETEVEVEPWFPAELIAKGEISGNSKLKGLAYSAKDFLKMPYTAGTFVQIKDTDYFVLLIQTT